MVYRKEIDGLRALAVVPVVLFHAGFGFFSGGYIGVDIFFVLSGYLITTIILTEKDAGIFSLISFYERRARRILPALFFVMAVCIPFAWFLMVDPVQLKQFTKSLVSVSLFVSNFQFWQESNYFAPASELKPLLHTWSLAIEEQYYLIFPAFMIVFWRFGKRCIVAVLAMSALFSLLLAQLSGNLSIYYPFFDPQFLWFNQSNIASFYLPTGRVWTLLTGVLVAFFLHTKPDIGNNNSASFIGLLMITYSIFCFDSTTPYPSIYTLLPVLGTALIIIFATSNTIAHKFLSLKGMVGIGLISYSTYLWHQPLLAFSRIIVSNESDLCLSGLLSFASIILGYFSWRFIERPFRDKQRTTRKQVFKVGVLSSLFFIGFGLAGYWGFERMKFSDKALNFINQYKGFELANPFYLKECGFPVPQRRMNKNCYIPAEDQETVLLWGDSYAQALGYGLRKNFGDAYFFAQVASPSCEPVLNFNDYESQNLIRKEGFCDKSNAFATSLIKNRPIKSVIFAQSSGHDKTDWEKMAAFAREHGVKEVYLVGTPPKWDISLPYVVAYYELFHSNSTSKNLTKSAIDQDQRLLSRYKNSKLITYISLIQYLCSQGECLIKIPNAPANDNLLLFDTGHLSISGSDFVSRKIITSYFK